MINLPPTHTLMPRDESREGACPIFTFRSDTTRLLRVDLLFEAGSAYQSQYFAAAAANKLCTVATEDMDSGQLAEFMDFRGVVVEPQSDVLQTTLSVYMLRRYADEVIPVVARMLQAPAWDGEDFRVWQSKRRSDVASAEQRTSAVARRLFYQALFGTEHHLGRYATAADVDRLLLPSVRQHFESFCQPGATAIVASGNVDDELLQQLRQTFGTAQPTTERITMTPILGQPQRISHPMEGAVQATVRMGRVLPLQWSDPDYASLMVLVTLLGGYFGSRLMSNLREDKGYTYGIYAHTQIYRGTIVFYITTDVAGGTAEQAVEEIVSELNRLNDEAVEEEELELVKTVLAGDFMRSVDGVFELAQRYVDMTGTDVDERFTDNLRHAIETVTPAELQRIASLYLRADQMTIVTAGAI